MEVKKFKTSIKCGGCINTVTPHLNKLEGIKWSVDLTHQDRILTVEGETVNENLVMETIKNAGYKIEKVS